MLGKILSGMVRAGEMGVPEGHSQPAEADQGGRQTPCSNQPDQQPDFQQPQRCWLGLVIQPLTGEISRGCNLPGKFISKNYEIMS